MNDVSESERARLSDRIVQALDLALEQEDLKIAETLTRALEMSMTRNSGGGEFVERRDYPPEIEKTMESLRALQKKYGAV